MILHIFDCACLCVTLPLSRRYRKTKCESSSGLLSDLNAFPRILKSPPNKRNPCVKTPRLVSTGVAASKSGLKRSTSAKQSGAPVEQRLHAEVVPIQSLCLKVDNIFYVYFTSKKFKKNKKIEGCKRAERTQDEPYQRKTMGLLAMRISI